MSIQTTNNISRHDAELRAVNKLLETKYTKLARSEVCYMEDEELEDFLDEQFDNYSIV